MNSTKASVRVGFVFGTTCLAFCTRAAAIEVPSTPPPDDATVAVLEEPMASSVTALPQGVIAMIGRNQPIPQEVLDHPYVTGILIRNWWPDTEPQEGVFDWSYFDQVVPQIEAAGKWIWLVIESGGARNTPQWVFDAGIETFTFIDQFADPGEVQPGPRQLHEENRSKLHVNLLNWLRRSIPTTHPVGNRRWRSSTNRAVCLSEWAEHSRCCGVRSLTIVARVGREPYRFPADTGCRSLPP